MYLKIMPKFVIIIYNTFVTTVYLEPGRAEKSLARAASYKENTDLIVEHGTDSSLARGGKSPARDTIEFGAILMLR
jgi:hypothetical protein